MKRGKSLQRLMLAVLVAGIAAPAFAAASLTEKILAPGYGPAGSLLPSAGGPGSGIVNGQTFTIIFTVTGAKISKGFSLPAVRDLQLNGTGTNPQPQAQIFNFFLTPMRAGDFTIPAFDIRTDDGQTLHAVPIRFHVKPQ